MAQFFFHRQRNGKLVEDHTGRSFSDEESACRAAFVEAAEEIRLAENDYPSDLHLGIEVSDGTRTCGIVRTSISIWRPVKCGSH